MNRKKLIRRTGTLLTVLMLITVSTLVTGAQATAPVDKHVTTPKDFLGYDIGDQYQLTPWQTHQMPDGTTRTGIVEYAYELQRTSNRVRVFQYGKSEMGKPMILTVVTSPKNWAQMSKLKSILKKLADPRQVASDDEARYLASQGKAVYWLSAAIHSTERTSPEVLLRLAYHLASGNDAWTLGMLDDMIVVLENTINPDGLDQVTEDYYGGPSAPGYGRYVNHDDNRDFLGLGLVESQQNVQARFEWLPTVYHDLHQAKDLLYMSPGNDPTNEAVSPITMNEWNAFAGHNIGQLTAQGHLGAFTWDYADMWYPGYNHGYSFMHNTNGRFYELQGASGMANGGNLSNGAHSATRILSTWGASRTWWDPAPYVGGVRWDLIDAVNMEEDAIKNDLDYTLAHKDELLMNFYLKGKTNMAKASGEAPYAFVIPANGGDNADVTDMINNLQVGQHIEVHRLGQAATLGGRQFATGDYVVRMDQPFGLTAKNLLTVQNYPPIKEPYDVTAWTYGLLRDVQVVPLTETLPAGLKLLPVKWTVPYAGTLTGGPSDTYVIEHGSNNNLAVALQQLWKDSSFAVSQADAPFTAGGRGFPAGTLVVRTTGTGKDKDAVQDTASGQGWGWSHDPEYSRLKALVQALGLTAYSVNAQDLEGLQFVALQKPRLAVYARYTGDFSDTNEGWTRIRLDRAGWSYTRLHPTELVSMTVDAYDVIVATTTSGMGTAGYNALKAFVEAGGTLILQGSASRLPVDRGWITDVSVAPNQGPAVAAMAPKSVGAESEEAEEDIPDFGGREPSPEQVKAAVLALAAADPDVPLNCPGSIVRLAVNPVTHVGYGYDAAESVWCESTLFYNVAPDSKSVVVASYPNDAETLLQSGYIAGESWMKGKAAIIDAPLGAGNMVMIAPNVVYRAQTSGTYMFLWNSLIEGSRSAD
jgi:hypothetical protein